MAVVLPPSVRDEADVNHSVAGFLVFPKRSHKVPNPKAEGLGGTQRTGVLGEKQKGKKEEL